MRRFRAVWICLILSVAGPACLSGLAADEVIRDPEQFIKESFSGEPESQVLWLDKPLKEEMAKILGHPYKGLRIRYWRMEGRTAWVLEEMGKIKLITAGFVVDDGELESMQVLIYRESHGWEVRLPFFTRQFKGLRLKDDGGLDREIDGISGATISVNALVRLSRLALFLHGEVVE